MIDKKKQKECKNKKLKKARLRKIDPCIESNKYGITYIDSRYSEILKQINET